jgi:putative ABC transport system ATP-binding protein
MSSLLSLRNVSKTFGTGKLSFTALYPSDVEVKSGEILLLVGPSGSGKTTLLSLMGCVLSPTSGEIFLEGQRIDGLKEDRLALIRRDKLSFVFQQFNLISSLNSQDNVELPLVLRGTPRRERKERAIKALEAVGLGSKLKSKPAQLSGGQQQRVAIARALASDPKILLCDEPTAALDTQSGRDVMKILQDLARRDGRAVVVVTHDTRVFTYGDRVLYLEDGRLVEGHEQAHA